MPQSNKYSNKRIKYVDKSIRELSEQSQKLQGSVWNSYLENVLINLSAKGKVIQNTEDNIDIINSLGELIDNDIRPGDGQKFIEWYVDQMDGLGALSEKYFNQQLESDSESDKYKDRSDLVKKYAAANRKKLLGLLGVTRGQVRKGSFLHNLIDFNQVFAKLQGGLITTILTGQPYDLAGAKKYVNGTPTGKIGKPKKGEGSPAGNQSGGAIEGAINGKTFDTFQQYDRTIQKGMANDLGLKYAIYQGGLIKTSRAFCIERNDRVYGTEEIEKFGTVDDKHGGYSIKPNFDGRKDPYNPFVDLGGWNCRHHYDWISDELAEELLKDQNISSNQPEDVKIKTYYKEAKKISEAKEVTLSIINGHSEFKVSQVSYSKDLSINEINIKNQKIEDLFRTYKSAWPGTEININFKSGGGAFGSIRYINGQKMTSINFGDRFDPARIAEWDNKNTLSEFMQASRKSRVDAGNGPLSTIAHEFAHSIAIKDNPGTEEFWKEMASIRSKYRKEIEPNLYTGGLDKLKELYLGAYAEQSIEEFMAEAFTEYKLRTNPSKYAKLVGELIDKYYKK